MLYQRTRELHAFAAQLETSAGNTRYFAALTNTGLLAMLSTASAGVAPTDRTRSRHLASLRDRLARFACALRSMADRGLLDDDVVRFGSELVRNAESLVPDFDVELRCIEAELLSNRLDAERSERGEAPANDQAVPRSETMEARAAERAALEHAMRVHPASSGGFPTSSATSATPPARRDTAARRGRAANKDQHSSRTAIRPAEGPSLQRKRKASQ